MCFTNEAFVVLNMFVLAASNNFVERRLYTLIFVVETYKLITYLVCIFRFVQTIINLLHRSEPVNNSA